MERTYSHIDLDERRKIARWRMAGLGVEVIAEKLGRHRGRKQPSIVVALRFCGTMCRDPAIVDNDRR